MPPASAPSTRKLTPEEEAALAAQPQPATAPPEYAPVEPGMYEPDYTGPGQYADPPPYQPPTYRPGNGMYPATEPGMYERDYQHPGQAVRTPPVVEPGMYEPNYTQPGYYTPRNASTYYGGPVWPVPWTGKERLATIPGVTQPGPNPAGIQVINPSTGEKTLRMVPDLGTAEVVNAGPAQRRDAPQATPSVTSRGDLFGAMSGGGVAPPTPAITLGPSALQLGYRFQQGDPGVVGRPSVGGGSGHEVRRSDLSTPIVDRLAGLFGGGERKTSQRMPLPPGTRRAPLRRR